MMNILVTGSYGFIGSHLVKCLRDKGLDVWTADVIHQHADARHTGLVPDDYGALTDLLSHRKYEVCINCAGSASVPFSFENPVRDYDLNTRLVISILEGIRIHNPLCKFITLSSAAVYGNPQRLPVHESCEQAPVSPYGYHKMMSETICSEYYRCYGINSVALRIFSAYGCGLRKQLFWDLFTKSKQPPVQLYGSGCESRDFIHVDDLVQAIFLVMISDLGKGVAVNVANGVEVTIAEVVRLFYRQFHVPVDYGFQGAERIGDPANWVADISRLREIGYAPTVELASGLQRYYEWLIQEG